MEPTMEPTMGQKGEKETKQAPQAEKKEKLPMDLKFKGHEFRERGKYYDFLLAKGEEAENLVKDRLLKGKFSEEQDLKYKEERQKGKSYYDRDAQWGKYGNLPAEFISERLARDLEAAKDEAAKMKVYYEIIASIKVAISECQESMDLLEVGKRSLADSDIEAIPTYFVSQTLNDKLFKLRGLLNEVNQLISEAE